MIEINLSYVLICFVSVWITPVILKAFNKRNMKYYEFAGYVALVYLIVQIILDALF